MSRKQKDGRQCLKHFVACLKNGFARVDRNTALGGTILFRHSLDP
ncbi:MAG TPA: hypothetical protein VMD08_14760 [Candidatus Baltobacteraceae bacterium]|nr:hypothetical protein [Candidatus Baltobacteraceae bacterium]